MYCRLCNDLTEEESERHLLKHIKIINKIESNVDLSNANYDDIFSENVEDQASITRVYNSIFKTRSKLLQEN